MRHLAWLKPIVVANRCAYWRHLKTALFGFCLCIDFGSGLAAATFEAGGLSFSDELGGFRLLSASGRGTASDPIILVEEITSLKPAVLTVRPIDAAQHESAPTPSLRVLMRSVIKVVVNKSAWRWTGFDLELRGEGGQASIYSDGLSFDQLSAMPTPFHSDLFASIRAEDEPHDRLRYDQGNVEPQQTVRIAFNLMDLNPRSLFYVAQEPIVLLTEGPTLPNIARPIYAGFAKPLVPVRHRSTNFPISP